MKFAWALVLFLPLLLAGCSGSNEPVNAGKDKPIPPTNHR